MTTKNSKTPKEEKVYTFSEDELKDLKEETKRRIKLEVEQEARDKTRKETLIYDPNSDSQSKRKGMGSGTTWELLKILIPCFVAFLLVSFIAPGKSQYQTDITRLEMDLVKFSNTQSDISKKVDSETKAISDVNSRFTNIQATVTELNNKAATKTDVEALKTTVGNTASKTDVETINKNVANIKAENATAITSIKDDLQKKIDKIIDGTTPIKGVYNTTTSTTGGTTTSGATGVSGLSSTYQGVTATIANAFYSWSGLPILSVAIQAPYGGTVSSITVTNGGSGYTSSPLVSINGGGYTTKAIAVASVANGVIVDITLQNVGAGYSSTPTIILSGGGGTNATAVATINPVTTSTASQSFQYSIRNDNTFTVYNLQIAMGLQMVDSTGNPITFTYQWLTASGGGTTNLSLSSTGFGIAWVYQQLLSPNLYVFANTSSSNIFGLGNQVLDGNGTTVTYTANVIVSNSNPAVMQNLYFVPVIKIYGYTK